jgi:hypothetical protein
MQRLPRISWALVLCFLTVFPTGEAVADTITLQDGTTLEGIVGNRDILAGTPYAFADVTILIEATREVLRLGLGPSFPVYPSDFENGWRMGWSGTLRLSFRLNSATRLNFGFEYNRYTLDSKPLTLWDSGPSVDGGSVSVFYLPAEIELRPRGAAQHLTSPYFVLGAGYYRLDVRDASVYVAGERHRIPGDWEHALGLHIGLGISADYWFVEGLAVYGLTDVDPTGHWAIRAGMQITDMLP